MAISEEVKSHIRIEAKNRCGYCQSQQQYVPNLFETEHIIPTARGGSDDKENLWIACRSCNMYKGDKISAIDPVTEETVRLFDPRKQKWKRHFTWSEDGTLVIGKTRCGRSPQIKQCNHGNS